MMQMNLGGARARGGSALEIVFAMKGRACGVDDLTLDEYMDWVVERVWAIEGERIQLGHGDRHERAERLLRGLARAWLARDLADLEDEEEDTDEDELDPTW
ncbi:MAG: hypothetical protein JST00_07815 [Deltaproteobacteria bacterium]|nr:hypothetical protein [Deltaproteobacteria bacterium]